MKSHLFTLLFLLFSASSVADVYIVDGWVRKPVAGIGNAAAYMTVRNTGGDMQRINNVRCEGVAHCYLHRVVHHEGIVRMQGVSAVDLPPNADTVFKPGGLHIMLVGLQEGFAENAGVSVLLELESGRAISTWLGLKSSVQ
jgi:copper(I)-binding protein